MSRATWSARSANSFSLLCFGCSLLSVCLFVCAAEIAELSSSLEGNPHLGAAISAFKSLDVDQTGTINFAELLRALFPLATMHHVQLMCVEVRAIEMTKKDVEVLQVCEITPTPTATATAAAAMDAVVRPCLCLTCVCALLRCVLSSACAA